jgi:hypothetical protein
VRDDDAAEGSGGPRRARSPEERKLGTSDEAEDVVVTEDEGDELESDSEPDHPGDAEERAKEVAKFRRRAEREKREARQQDEHRQKQKEENGGVSPRAWEDYLDDESEEAARASIPQFPQFPSPPPAIDDATDEALLANRLISPGVPVAGRK